MTRQTKQVGVVLALVAMISFGAWPFWKYMYHRQATAELQERTRALVDANPELKVAWIVAMQDDVLTEQEATAIVEGANDQAMPEE